MQMETPSPGAAERETRILPLSVLHLPTRQGPVSLVWWMGASQIVHGP